jgi:hypothetical protein
MAPMHSQTGNGRHTRVYQRSKLQVQVGRVQFTPKTSVDTWRSGVNPWLRASHSSMRCVCDGVLMGNIAGFQFAVCRCAMSTEAFSGGADS